MSSILFTSAGKRVSLVKAFQTELHYLIPEAKVITTDASPELSAACTVADHYFKVPRLDHPTYINELISNCTSNNINLVIPTIDTELLILAENRDKLLSHGINSVISCASHGTKTVMPGIERSKEISSIAVCVGPK